MDRNGHVYYNGIDENTFKKPAFWFGLYCSSKRNGATVSMCIKIEEKSEDLDYTLLM